MIAHTVIDALAQANEEHEAKRDDSRAISPGDNFAVWALEQIKDADPVFKKWERQSRECDEFAAGEHFSKGDKEARESEGRPTAIFGAAQKWERFISGLEQQAQFEVQFLARDVMNPKQTSAGELVTKVYEYVMQNCEGDDERSIAFMDMLRRGMGWTDTILTRERDPQGAVMMSRVDGREMRWDTRATKPCLEDARWVGRIRTITKKEAKKRWPDFAPTIDLSVASRSAMDQGNESTLYSEKSAVPQDSSTWPSTGNGNIEVIEFQWYDEETQITFVDPLEKKIDTLDEDAFFAYHKRYKERLPELIKMTQDAELPDDIEYDETIGRKYKRCVIIGQKVVAGPFPLPGNRYSFNCMTGQWNAADGYWFGFMRILIDPQKYLTKFVNQVMEILTRSPKGGAVAEVGTFVNKSDAEARWGQAGSVIEVNPGMMEKWKEKPAANLPAGATEMVQVCTQMLREVTGIDPAGTMGMGGGDVPLVTLKQRFAAMQVLLAREFSSLRRYHKSEARTVYAFMRYIADDRWVRVGGPYNAKSIKLAKAPFYLDYDVVLDEGTRDPAAREQYWATLAPMIPKLIQMNAFHPDLLYYAPLPASVIHMIQEAIKSNTAAKAEMAKQGIQMGGRGKPTSMAEIQARAKKVEADAALSQAKALAIGEDIRSGRGKAALDAYLKQLEMQERQQTQQQQMQLQQQQGASKEAMTIANLLGKQQQGGGAGGGDPGT